MKSKLNMVVFSQVVANCHHLIFYLYFPEKGETLFRIFDYYFPTFSEF